MVLHTIVLYGSEIAIDQATRNSIFVLRLKDYNSALVKTSFMKPTGGSDFGAPVRMQAHQLLAIIETDDGIRRARATARQGQESLVPLGDLIDLEPAAAAAPQLSFGQGVEKSIGAGYDLSAVPGMYDGRPERYFDNSNDIRKGHTTGDHQFTREVFFFECFVICT
jgi:hypothetical protein